MAGTEVIDHADFLRLAGTPAVAEVLPVGEEGAKDAVLHVEHGHVLVQDDLEPVGMPRPKHSQQLGDVQVGRSRDGLQIEPLQEPCRRERIGDVEAEVSDLAGFPEEASLVVVAYQPPVGIGT